MFGNITFTYILVPNPCWGAQFFGKFCFQVNIQIR